MFPCKLLCLKRTSETIDFHEFKIKLFICICISDTNRNDQVLYSFNDIVSLHVTNRFEMAVSMAKELNLTGVYTNTFISIMLIVICCQSDMCNVLLYQCNF